MRNQFIVFFLVKLKLVIKLYICITNIIIDDNIIIKNDHKISFTKLFYLTCLINTLIRKRATRYLRGGSRSSELLKS